jgi:putrescine transport system substrate-binding protein
LKLLCAFVVLVWIGATPAVSGEPSPFEPLQTEKPNRIRILAFANYFDQQVPTDFGSASEYQIACDAYEPPDAVAAMLREGPCDIITVRRSSLAREVTAGALQKFDRTKAPDALNVAPAVAAKLAAYDRSTSYAIASGWLYIENGIPKRLGAPLRSCAALFKPEQARKPFDCGIEARDSPDDLLVAVWRYLGVDPAKVEPSHSKRVVGAVSRAKMGFRAFGVPDLVGALAGSSGCIAMGSHNAAQFALARAVASGQQIDIRFALRHGGDPMSLDAISIPADAPDVLQACALADFLLRPAT